MYPDEEPENQLLNVSLADITAYKASKKAATDKAAAGAAGIGGLSSFAGYGAAHKAGHIPGSQAGSELKTSSAGAAAHHSKQHHGAGLDLTSTPGGSGGILPNSQTELRWLQCHKQQLLGKPLWRGVAITFGRQMLRM